jgi:hypothetical protein
MRFAPPPSASIHRGPAYLQFGMMMSALIATVVIVLTATSTEPALTFMALGVLIVGAKLLWRPGEPPILFAAFLIQWLQISSAVFRASFSGQDLSALYTGYYGVGDGVVTATWLSLFGLLALTSGIRLALRGIGPAVRTQLILEIEQYSLRKALGIYCIAQLTVVGIETVTWMNPGLTQPLIALSNFRWVFFFALALIVLVQRRGYWLLTLVSILEIVRGFLSFFGEYKNVFLVLAMAFLTARPKFNPRTAVKTSLIIGVVLVLSAVWSEVKRDYRDFLSGGSGRQEVIVTPAEQLERLNALFFNEGLTHLSDGFNDLIQRIEYTFFFGRVIEHVPSVIPYDDGAFWGGAVMHVLTPRLLFPDKADLSSDVQNTEYYAGLELIAQGGKQTEIPMGYMAESYIDFGSLGMLAPIFVLGLLFGFLYRYVITRRRYMIFAFGAAPILILPASKYEIGAAKILGGTLTTFLVFLIGFHLCAPYIHRAFQRSPSRRTEDSTPKNRLLSSPGLKL